MTISTHTGFKEEQLKQARVAMALNNSETAIDSLLAERGIHAQAFALYWRAFKDEGVLEAWVCAEDQEHYQLLKQYGICAQSGVLGPKRKQGDLQVPEGFYHIDRFNPWSSYHLSLGINYPNPSDRILSDKRQPGGDIFIHGDCLTIGCLPMTDRWIEEIYILCVESKDRGAHTIPVSIFPCRMTPAAYGSLQERSREATTLRLWSDLKMASDYFDKEFRLPRIKFLDDGGHEVLAAQE